MTVERLQEFTAGVVAQFEGLKGERDGARAACAGWEARAVSAEAGLAALKAEVEAAKDPARLPFWGTPAWQDEFDGDLSKWRVRDGESLSYDKARILARNNTVRDGKLVITVKRETVLGRDFTTGYLDTIGKHSQRYGRWEIRAKVPTLRDVSRGIWPAFWLRDDKAGGELDIMEAWGHPRVQQEQFAGMSHMVCHESTNGTGRKKELVWEHEIRKQTGKVLPQVGEDFHTWAIEFTPEHLKGYYDGALVFNHTPATVPWLWGPEFANPMNIRLNVQVGQNYHGHPVGPDYTDTVTPAEFLVDHVRVWALPA